jgi:hypothetical protein
MDMLEKILASESIKAGGKVEKGSKDVAEESSQFSKILASLDSGAGIGKGKEVKGGELFQDLQELFADDKEFLQESFKLLKDGKKEAIGEKESSKPNLVFGLNFGGDSSKLDDKQFVVIINKAKEFLKHELLKKGTVSESELPKTLRGLTQLAESRGIKLKDIKFDLNADKSSISSNSSQVDSGALKVVTEGNSLKAVINQHSTEALLREKSLQRGRAIKANVTDMTPQNLTESSAKETKNIDVNSNKFSLEAILSGEKVSNQNSATSTKGGVEPKTLLNLSAQSKTLGDIFKSEESMELLQTKSELPKNLGMAEKVGKPLNMTPEFVSSLFSKDEMGDIFGTTNGGTAEDEVLLNGASAEESAISSVDKKSGLQLKIGEAQIMSRHLASNLQQQVENYKHPFQKMSLTLQPDTLGEIEVDIFKRGNSVKINLTGNSQTVAILSANQMELRNQLITVGLENPNFKFNEDGKNGQSQYQQQNRDNLSDEQTEEDRAVFEIDVLERVLSA